jgi:hypothetical protein
LQRAGRKPLLLWGAGGMMASAAVLTVCLVAKESNPSASSALGGTALLFVMLYVVFFEIGLGAIPWMIGGEFFAEAPRAGAMGTWIFCAPCTTREGWRKAGHQLAAMSLLV